MKIIKRAIIIIFTLLLLTAQTASAFIGLDVEVPYFVITVDEEAVIEELDHVYDQGIDPNFIGPINIMPAIGAETVAKKVLMDLMLNVAGSYAAEASDWSTTGPIVWDLTTEFFGNTRDLVSAIWNTINDDYDFWGNPRPPTGELRLVPDTNISVGRTHVQPLHGGNQARRAVLKTSVADLETILNLIMPEMNQFVGPIDIVQANANWSLGNLHWQHAAENNLHMIPVIRDTELFDGWGHWGINIHTAYSSDEEIERFNSMLIRMSRTTDTINIGGRAYTVNLVLGGDSPTQRMYRVMLYRNGERMGGFPSPDRISLNPQQQITITPIGWLNIDHTAWNPLFPLELQQRLYFLFLRRSPDESGGVWYGVQRVGNLLYRGFDASEERNVSVGIAAQNIITNQSAVMDAVRGASGAQSDDDIIYLWWPQTMHEWQALMATGTGASTIVLNPSDWVEAEEEDDVIVVPGFPAIPQDWLDAIQRDLAASAAAAAAAAAGVQALPYAMGGTMQFQFPVGNQNRITTIFPFSIPFSLARSITMLSAPATPPRFTADFNGTVFDGFVLDIDFAWLENIAMVIRWTVWVGFFVGLMFATKKIIQW